MALVVIAVAMPPTGYAFVHPSLVLTTGKTDPSSSATEVGLMNFLNDGKKALVKSLAGEYDSASIKARIDGLVDNNPVFMFSFTTCPFCIKAKQVLDDIGAKYTVVELDTDPDGKAIRAEMAELVGRTSVPAIWISGQFVGGCNDGPMGGIVSLNNSGKLKGMLREIGAL
jgi:glutaredoxin 3